MTADRAAIWGSDRGPSAGHGTVNRIEIDQQTTKRWRDEMSGEVGPVLFYHVSTRRILECTIGFEAVVGVREAYHENLGLVEVRPEDLRKNPAWRQQTGSSISARCLMFLRIGQASSGRRRSGKHVGTPGTTPENYFRFRAATVEFN